MHILNDKNRIVILPILLVYFVLFFFWCYINLNSYRGTTLNYLFGLLLAFMPLSGFIAAVYVSKQWGFAKSIFGRSILFVGIGLLLWSIGTFVFAFYNLFLGIEVPYPSIADIFYFGLYIFYFIGCYLLMKVNGASFELKTTKGKITIFLIPLLLFLFTYEVLFNGLLVANDFQITITLFFDLFYPLSDVLLLSITLISIVLGYKYVGGKYKFPMYLLLFGFIVEFVADYFYTITTSNETFFVGSYVDFLFLCSTFLVSLAIALFSYKST